ncbi:MAG: GvpL/GvpF family gas vesicle protein, partial [bacterium]|nr:GvpL/GvpF family gas vesicle protein [bacterium]
KILEVLKGVSTDYRSNKLFGDKMIMNGAFLVQNDQVPKFDKCVDELDERLGEGIKFKYVGPVPPCNFVEIVINLED